MTANHKITFIYGEREISVQAAQGESLLSVMRGAGLPVESPCGGRGSCGKCRVTMTEGGGECSPEERALLSASDISEGVRLACKVAITGDMRVEIREGAGAARVLTEGGALDEGELDPSLRVVDVATEPPSLEDQRSDVDRLLCAVGAESIDSGLLGELPDAIRGEGLRAAIFDRQGSARVVSLLNSSAKNLGLAVDIGTTTMAAYLIDLVSGARIGVASRLNPQRAYGGDVISRVDYTSGASGRIEEMRALVCGAIEDMAGEMIADTGFSFDDVRHIVPVGNTIMLHLFAGLPSKNIAILPFTPVYSSAFEMRAGELGISTMSGAVVTLPPCVSGYVGADTVAAALACDMDINDDISLLIDIGTNGEIMLGGRGGLMCCSAAAGPAFEGAHIARGSGAAAGAVDRVGFDGDLISLSVIGGGAPSTICGSGLVDAVAGMLNMELIDETGLIDDTVGGWLQKHLFDIDGRAALSLDMKGEGGVYICQKDLREVQLAKGAIAAGIEILMRRMNIGFSDISRLYLAGGFGNYIDVGSAAAIGLLPGELAARTVPVGNAAGTGARRMLKDRAAMGRATKIKEMCGYVELSACAEFQDIFVERMLF